MGEEHCSERAGHGWPAPVLQAEQDARAKQGECSAQGWVYSASSEVCRRTARLHSFEVYDRQGLIKR
jgi:hypothetical protein